MSSLPLKKAPSSIEIRPVETSPFTDALFEKFEPLSGLDVTFHSPVQNHVPGLDNGSYAAIGSDR